MGSIQLGDAIYEVVREPGSKTAVLTGSGGEVVEVQQRGVLWVASVHGSVAGWCVSDGPTNLRALPAEEAGWLLILNTTHPQLAALLNEYAESGDRASFAFAAALCKGPQVLTVDEVRQATQAALT